MLECLEGGKGGEVKDHQSRDGAPKVRSGDGPKGLLASSIPDLQFYFPAVDFYGFGPELYPQSGLVLIFEPVFQKPEEETTLADIWMGQRVLVYPTRMNLNR